jgi:DNA (cytosine-5)-methyltransferase 1
VTIKKIDSGVSVTLIDLFAGIGGFHYGIQAAASKVDRPVEPVIVSEIETSCQDVYRDNHKCDVRGDIMKIKKNEVQKELKERSLDDVDFVTAGFPCQPFSNSGRKLGLADPRGQFYGKIAEIIEASRAKVFILENVPGIRLNGGGSFESILAVHQQKVGLTMNTLEKNLQKLKNYNVRWIEIDSSTVGSPQVRKRVYIVGLRKDLGVLPDLQNIGGRKRNNFMSIAGEMKIPELELSANQNDNMRRFMTRDQPPSYKDGMRRVGKAYLCEGGNVGQGYHAHGLVPTLTKVWARFLPIYFPSADERLPVIGEPDFDPGPMYGTGYIRRASVREVMLLQGFPKSFGPHENSRIAYEHAGNAVNARVVEEIARLLMPCVK